MIGPLSSQLNAIKWGEFRLGDLFEMERGTRLTKANRIKGTRPLVTAGYENYGVAEYISNHEQKVFKGNTITIDMFANAFYRYGEYSADDNILVLTPKFTMSHRIGLCVTARINAVLKAKFSYGKQYRQKDFNVTTISLPTTQDGGIDFHFMEKFIAELEQCRLAELEAYLKAAGLENTTLSNDEENALNVFNGNNSGGGGGKTPCGLKWQSFRLGDLFEASNGDFDIQKRHINHRGEFVITAGLSNNGVLGQSDIKAKVFESHTITIDMFGCAFYRSFPYKMVTHARVFSLKPQFEINHKIGLFLSTLFFGYPKKFGYENMCSWAKIKNDKVILPLKPTAKTQTLDDVDFHFMHTLINALMKQTIQGVVQYSSAKIQATKEVISQETPVQKDSLF